MPADTVIRNNTFTDTFFESIKVYTRGRNAVARNITIEDNSFSGWPDSAMNLSRIQGGLIRGNRIETGSDAGKAPVPVVIRNSEQVKVENNTIQDERAGLLAAFDLSQDVDAASLLMTDNSTTLDPDFPNLMQIVPALVIQARNAGLRPLRTDEDTGAYLRAGLGETSHLVKRPIWTLHPPWKNGLRGALLFELPADFGEAEGIRFATRSATGQGDGVRLTIEWKPAKAPNSEYRIFHESTIQDEEWTKVRVPIDSRAGPMLLRFRFDCGPADNAGYDTVQIADIDVFTESD
jgi:hypothetical protein